MAGDPWTSGELQRAIEELKATVSTGIGGIHRRLDELDRDFIRRDVYELAVKNLTERLNGSMRWVYGITIAIVSAGITGLGAFLLRGHP